MNRTIVIIISSIVGVTISGPLVTIPPSTAAQIGPSLPSERILTSLPHQCHDDPGVVCIETKILPYNSTNIPLPRVPPFFNLSQLPPLLNQSQYNPPPPQYNCPPGGNSTANGTLWGCVIKQIATTDTAPSPLTEPGNLSYIKPIQAV